MPHRGFDSKHHWKQGGAGGMGISYSLHPLVWFSDQYFSDLALEKTGAYKL